MPENEKHLNSIFWSLKAEYFKLIYIENSDNSKRLNSSFSDL